MGRRKLRAENNKLVKQTEKSTKPKAGSERIDEIDNRLARLIKTKMEKTQMINNQKEGADITRDRTGIKVNS